MANPYYNYDSAPPRQNRQSRIEAPLPPLPLPKTSYMAYRSDDKYNSPTSPYAESPRFPSTRDTSRQSLPHSRYSVSGSGRGSSPDDADGFADDIPLRAHKNSHDDLPPSESPRAKDGTAVTASSRPRRRRQKKKKSLFGRDATWVVYILTLIQLAVFIAELVKNSILTGTPIEIHPQVNPMLGPSIYVLINMGARYVPCMKNVEMVQDSPHQLHWPCPNTTSDDVNSPLNMCQLSDLCGFSGVPNPVPHGSIADRPAPNQWFRFITPIFLHAGFVHITFNLILQLTLGREIEQIIGSVRFAIVYFASGIFGFVMGGNFAPVGVASTGASGALFGIIAINLLDLLYTWQKRRSPWTELAWIAVDIIVSFVLGLLPGLDNFAHIGGFLMGLVLGVCILRSPKAFRERVVSGEMPFRNASKSSSEPNSSIVEFIKQPVGFFRDRKGAWWAWWLVRAVALVGALICFIMLLRNFYVDHRTCSWCKYLSCLDIHNWCDVGNLQLQNLTSNGTSSGTGTSSKRDFFGVLDLADLSAFY
ncbi:hypothetical protein MMC25_004872 [Agyrium rufum]|nr:hypothetical protein [Agyrium rufum]